MNRVAISFLTKDRVELTRQTIEPLLQRDKFNVFWCDGSSGVEGQNLPNGYPVHATRPNVRGGADAAIVYALTEMLKNEDYSHVGLCENDVLLQAGWFDRTMELFEISHAEGLNVGAASPRCYEDRILVQREGYAVCHNTGAGIVIFTREAARLILDAYRTTFSLDNRLIFGQLAGVDIGTYWAFRGDNRWLTADWGFDAVLASAGLASLALTPSPVEMIGQVPSLSEQGLTLAKIPVERFRNEHVFETFRDNLARVYQGKATMTAWPPIHRDSNGGFTFFPHQVRLLGARFSDDWRLQWCQGFGPFVYRASEAGAIVTISITGVCEILVSGGKTGGRVEVNVHNSGYTCTPSLAPEGPQTQVMSIIVPGGPARRDITLLAVDAGAVFYGIRTGTPQMMLHAGGFEHSVLPPV